MVATVEPPESFESVHSNAPENSKTLQFTGSQLIEKYLEAVLAEEPPRGPVIDDSLTRKLIGKLVAEDLGGRPPADARPVLMGVEVPDTDIARSMAMRIENAIVRGYLPLSFWKVMQDWMWKEIWRVYVVTNGTEGEVRMDFEDEVHIVRGLKDRDEWIPEDWACIEFDHSLEDSFFGCYLQTQFEPLEQPSPIPEELRSCPTLDNISRTSVDYFDNISERSTATI